MTTLTKLSKAGYPKEVPVLTKDDICRGDYVKGNKCCLIGWVNTVFHDKDFIRTSGGKYSNPTPANIRALEIIKDLANKVRKNNKNTYPVSWFGVEDFNDTTSKQLKLSLGFLAKLFNTMLYKIGYDIHEEDRLNEKEFKQ